MSERIKKGATLCLEGLERATRTYINNMLSLKNHHAHPDAKSPKAQGTSPKAKAQASRAHGTLF